MPDRTNREHLETLDALSVVFAKLMLSQLRDCLVLSRASPKFSSYLFSSSTEACNQFPSHIIRMKVRLYRCTT